MGWWTAGEGGESLLNPGSTELAWGDTPADIMDEAVDKIIAAFEDYLERNPTKTEIRAGLEFCLGGYPTEEVMSQEALERLEDEGKAPDADQE